MCLVPKKALEYLRLLQDGGNTTFSDSLRVLFMYRGNTGEWSLAGCVLPGAEAAGPAIGMLALKVSLCVFFGFLSSGKGASNGTGLLKGDGCCRGTGHIL